jgi:protein tyrosine phosphatase (PTP) superfamily phosphohydrolase (DUF442 family)
MTGPEGIYNWHRLDGRITTSGQPTEQQLSEIHALGVRHIVNLGLHSHEKALPDEAASVSRLGMKYIHIPVDFGNPTEDDFQQFCAVIADSDDVARSFRDHVARDSDMMSPGRTALCGRLVLWRVLGCGSILDI